MQNIPTPKIVDPGHFYEDWGTDYDGGNLDGFCHEYEGYSVYLSTCPSYSFVARSDTQPYVDIAGKYGWANYMFQTNEGPSFPAHQFLFTGTSAPVAPKDANNYYLDFVADNADFGDSGCPYAGVFPKWTTPDGSTKADPNQNECYPHDSLVTAASDCGAANCDLGFSWRYYTPTPGIIWNAPAGIPEVCYGENDLLKLGQPCLATEYSSHIVLPDQGGHSDAPIFDDLYNCKQSMPMISWVIPDVAWSDHPQGGWKKDLGSVYGASWVGDIINAVRQACDGKYWTTEPTAIFVVWDDWGGWFDHVAPYVARQENPHAGYNQCDPSSQWGCGYTSGFRVPLLVASPYTGTYKNGTYSGYISGPCGASPLPPCPNNVFPFVHDFGSILAFTEYNFNMPFIYQGTNYYADWNAPDWSTDHKTVVPLSDFFPLSAPRPFVSILTQKDYTFFTKYYATTGTSPTGPDDDNAADQ
jgi:phospholipase C